MSLRIQVGWVQSGKKLDIEYMISIDNSLYSPALVLELKKNILFL